MITIIRNYIIHGVGWLAVGLAMALAACGTSAPARRATAMGYHGVVVTPPLPRPDFTLSDTHGRPFDFRAATGGDLTLLYFGYTNCPDVCPVHLANIAAVLQKMPELRRRVTVVFVTTDPDRDTPERLQSWLANFDPAFIGLRGSVDEVNRIQAALNLPPAAKQPAAGGTYTVGHSAEVIAFTPDDRAHMVYPFGTRQLDWASDLPRLVRDTTWTAE